MKKKQLILAVFAIIAASCSSNQEKQTQGKVIDTFKDNVVISSEKDTLMFCIDSVEKDAPDGIAEGDSIVVYHKGDAPTAHVSKIVVTRPEALKVKTVKGIVLDGMMNTVMVGVGKDTMSFSTVDAEKDCPDGMLIGDSITVYYKNSDQGYHLASKIVIPARADDEK